MRKTIQWSSAIGEYRYDFVFENIEGKLILAINGHPVEIKLGFWSTLTGNINEKFMFGGSEAYLVISKGNADIAINGVFINSGKQYKPRQRWPAIFVVLCCLLPVVGFVSSGGSVLFIIGLGCAGVCAFIAESSQPTGGKVALCTLITIAAWSLSLFFMML